MHVPTPKVPTNACKGSTHFVHLLASSGTVHSVQLEWHAKNKQMKSISSNLVINSV